MDSEFYEYLQEGWKLLEAYPEILKRIEADLGRHGQAKKKLRLEDEAWKQGRQRSFAGVPEAKAGESEPALYSGRPRMSAEAVYLFILIRGYGGGIKSQRGWTFIQESRTLHCWLELRGLKLPGKSTVVENLNAVGEETHQFIFDSQVRYLLELDPEDFQWITLDSTATEANSRWPLESELLTLLVKRMVHQGRRLDRFGLENFQPRNFEKLTRLMKKHQVAIAFSQGKRQGEIKRQRHYKALLQYAGKGHTKIQAELEQALNRRRQTDLLPSMAARLDRCLAWIQNDLKQLQQVMEACRKRVMESVQTPSREKVLSLSDAQAAIIQKGQREPVLGYKPQLVRTEKGFISVLKVPEGNANDAAQLDDLLEQHRQLTGKVPTQVSVDDGYAKKALWKKWTDAGVEIFSVSGSKGKKMIPTADYSSQAYQEARDQRSAVESLIYTIKFRFDFGEVTRRGISAVRQELLEKALAYNFCRNVQLRQRALRQKAA
ncbi:MAG: transposase [SAR324 cluster bacterium]|nr:transposase [SAR324 cluster bacterium]